MRVAQVWTYALRGDGPGPPGVEERIEFALPHVLRPGHRRARPGIAGGHTVLAVDPADGGAVPIVPAAAPIRFEIGEQS